MIILLLKIMLQVQVTTKIILIKNYKLKYINKRITQMIILLPKKISQFQVTAKMILIKIKVET